jgi:transposase-like protein
MIKEDLGEYFFIEGQKTVDSRKRRHLSECGGESDKTIGPRSFVSRWHNNGNEFKRSKISVYTEDFKVMVTTDCVENNITLVNAAKKYGIAHATIKNWFCIYKVRERRMQHLRERALKLASEGLKTSEIAQALGVSVRAANNYKNGR